MRVYIAHFAYRSAFNAEYRGRIVYAPTKTFLGMEGRALLVRRFREEQAPPLLISRVLYYKTHIADVLCTSISWVAYRFHIAKSRLSAQFSSFI